jgi:hypothetical protein
MDCLEAILASFASLCGDRDRDREDARTDSLTAADAGAINVVNELKHAEKSGLTLQEAINDIAIQAGGWSEYLAETILHLLEKVLKAGAPMGAAMRDAYEKSAEAAGKLTTFAKDHPVLCTVVALGILWLLAPVVMSALGFTVEGIAEGESVWRCE